MSDLTLDAVLSAMPVIAILRGVRTDEAVAIVETLVDEGIRVAEVPLNSPTPFETIALLRRHFDGLAIIGAGTVTDPMDVAHIAACGTQICLAPDCNPEVIERAISAGIVAVPGFCTATEAFSAIRAGARYLKLFPADTHYGDIAALRAVLPRETKVIGVGGVSAVNVADLLRAGCDAVGVGSDLYRPGDTISTVRDKARAICASAAAAAVSVELLCAAKTVIGESPIWLPEPDRVIWLDPAQGLLLKYSNATARLEKIKLAVPLSAIARLPDGRFAAISDDAIHAVDPDTGEITLLARVDTGPGCRLNDMVADSTGTIWTGSMHRGLLSGQGALFCLRPGASKAERVADGLGVTNGMCLSPTGDVLYVVDTLARTVLAFPVDAANGGLGHPRIVTDFLGIAGKPDGMAMAADGSLWVAMWGGGFVVRLNAQGAIEQRVTLPAPNVSSLCFGGMNGETMFVTSSRFRLSQAAISGAPASGGLFGVNLARSALHDR
jgi:Entner-Doudoroff aldolase